MMSLGELFNSGCQISMGFMGLIEFLHPFFFIFGVPAIFIMLALIYRTLRRLENHLMGYNGDNESE